MRLSSVPIRALTSAPTKNVSAHVGGELCAARFTDSDSVATFVADAQKVSQTTYQWRLLGLGLRDAAELRATLGSAARTAGYGPTFSIVEANQSRSCSNTCIAEPIITWMSR